MSAGSRPSSQAGHAGRGASTSRRVIVSLEFLPANTPVQTPITNEFSSHLPLTDLQWKSSSRSTIRTIETLNLDFRPFRDSVRDSQLQQIPINLLERPYLHLLFIASDDNEAYRVTLRPQIREWLNTVQSKRLQEWLIVHVTSQKTGPAKFYQRKASVFDKIRADFNVSKRDRVLQLPVPGSQADENVTGYATIWRDFLAKTKESIVLSFDGNFTSYEEDVRKVDAQRQMPGWNFCTFFIQKEGLAHSFEAMNLLEDALIQYDELEASYYLGAKDQTLPWFSRIGGTMEHDDSISILSSSGKQYRHLIMQNEITVFDFRIYLFARQASLVTGLGRMVDLVKRAKFFIYSMARLLRSHRGLLRKYFIESWIYTACLEVVNKCHEMLNARKMNAAAIPDLLPMLAELLELATRQVEKLGMTFGYLPQTHPFLMSMHAAPLDDGDETENGSGQDVHDTPEHFESSNPALQHSFEDEAAFDAMYRQLLDRVHEAWTGSMRTRSADKIKGTLAALEQARKHSRRSLEIYSSLSKQFTQTHWLAIEAQILRQTTTLREGASDPDSQTERLLSVLALVRTGLEAGSLRWTLGTKNMDGAHLARALLTEAETLSKQLDKDFAVIDVPAFSVTLGSAVGGFLRDEDGISILLAVTNHLPCAIEADEVRVKMLSMSDEPLWLKSEATTLVPGSNEVRLSALISLVGTYALETSQIRTSRIVFQHSHRPSSYRQEHLRTHLAFSRQPLVVFTQDSAALDIVAEEAVTMSVDQPRKIILAIHPGRQALTKATIHFPGASTKIGIMYETARRVQGDCTITSMPQDRSITLSDFTSQDVVKIAVDYHSLVQSQHVFLNVTVDYHTDIRPEKRRTLRTCIRLRTALPLDVTVHDYRREKFLLSKFTVSTVQRLPLRIKDATLASTARFKAVPACKTRTRAVIVRRDQPGSFPFRLERQPIPGDTSQDIEEASKLRIDFVYRTLESDLHAALSPHLSRILSKHNIQPSRRIVEAISCQLIADTKLTQRFNRLHVIDSLGQDDIIFDEGDLRLEWRNFREALRSYWTSDDEWDRIWAAILEACQTPMSTSLLVNEPWQTVSIPFEVPSIAIFNRVSFKISKPDEELIEVGQHISCTVNINSSFDWAAPNDREHLQKLCDSADDQHNIYGKGQRMLYEIQANQSDWVVSGNARADFFISNANGSALEFPLVLIPLREGKLFLPTISVHPLPALSEEEQAPDEQSRSAYDNLPTYETYQQDAATYMEVISPAAAEADLKVNTQEGEVVHSERL